MFVYAYIQCEIDKTESLEHFMATTTVGPRRILLSTGQNFVKQYEPPQMHNILIFTHTRERERARVLIHSLVHDSPVPSHSTTAVSLYCGYDSCEYFFLQPSDIIRQSIYVLLTYIHAFKTSQ